VKIRRNQLAAVAAAGALLVTVAGTALAASPAKLTLAIGDTTVGATSTGATAHVRVVHGSPDAPMVDVYVGATLATAAKVAPLSGLSFGDVSAYVDVPAGTYGIKVCATAAPTVCPIQVAALALAADQYYTIAASDLLASIKATVFTDTPAPTGAGVQLRVYHLSADTPAVDVLTAAGGDINAALDNLAYPNATGYLTLPASSYDVKVCAHADHAICPIGPAALTVAANHTYSIFAIGSLAATVATPTPTAPPTSTVLGSDTSDSSGSPIALLVLGLVLVAGTAGSLRFVAVRNRR
jgi:hypothetical protein